MGITTDRVREILSWYGRRNSFQRKQPDALKFLGTIMGIYAGTQK